ncbi:unnamed protein product [Heterobilharzia americana]|nr:unnamed protein product [Heterobilharzia americana]
MHISYKLFSKAIFSLEKILYRERKYRLQEEHRRIMQTMKDEISQLISVMNNSNLVKAKLEDQIEEYQLEIKQLHATIEKECWREMN